MDAADWDARYREHELVWSAEPNVFVAEEAAGLAPGRALDLAAGEGRNAIWLAEQGWQVEAVEFSGVAIEKGAALAADHGVEVAWTFADLRNAPRLEPADLVLLAYLQLPWAELSGVLRHAATLVRPVGTVLVIAHARRNLTDGYGGPPSAELLPEPEPVAAALAQAGLVVDRADEVTRTVTTEDGPRQAIDVLVRAHRPSS